jgi:hypothetical protein
MVLLSFFREKADGLSGTHFIGTAEDVKKRRK